MIFVDSNVLIDVLTPDQVWFVWSRSRLAACGANDVLVVNQIVLAELAANFDTLPSMIAALGEWDIAVERFEDEVAFVAGQAFRAYRRRYRERNAMLSDFLIGAHALALNATLLTRDESLYRTYFPELTLITPETDNG